jgi:polyisoprenoid-binding protein YceI
VPWEFDAPHSRIGFIARHLGLTFVQGYFRKADVKVDLNVADPTKSSIAATIDAASLTSDFVRRDDAVKGENYLDVERYPHITFTSKRVEPHGEQRYAIIGDLTLHGVTRELVLDTEYFGEVTDARGNTLRGLAARGKIRKGDFDIHGSPADPHAVAEEIQLVIDAELYNRGAN